MNAENIAGKKSPSDQISSEDGEDKKFVSQAVTFVIGHARNGFVALCASVASLLKEQARLKQEVESSQHEILLLKQSIQKADHLKKADLSGKTSKKEVNTVSRSLTPDKSEPVLTKIRASTGIPENSTLGTKNLKQLSFRRLKGCICIQCADAKNCLSLTIPVRIGEKVIIQGELCGIVRYIGHLDLMENSQIFVGIQLDEPVGDSNGSIGNKVFFSVPSRHGIFVPLSYILCVIS